MAAVGAGGRGAEGERKGVRLIPLGGLGEFGANSMLIAASNGENILLDAGAAFSDLESFGVAYEVPDFAALDGPPLAVLLTHGHDDHLKGLGHLVSAFPAVPAYGSAPTVARVRLNEWLSAGAGPVARTLSTGKAMSLGSWSLEALGVSHSIPGTVMLRVQAEGVTLVAATDFRLAPSALGETTSLDALAQWGREGVEVMLLDSTNALVAAAPPTEAEVASTLGELVTQARGAVVGVIFASHAGRFLQFAQAAVATGRVVIPLGRGLEEMLAVQTAVGGLGLPPGTVRPARELARLPRERLVIVATGSQGESEAAFTRLALDGVSGFRLQAADLVIHAARLIPGHERRLAALFDHCVRRGAAVVTAEQAPVHASGHPHGEELKAVLEALRPRWVLPVHGRRRHLEAAAALARHLGCRTVVVENGQPVRWREGELRPEGSPSGVGRILVSDNGAALDTALVRQRRQVAHSGAVIVIIPRDGAGGDQFAEPELSQVGLALPESELRCLLAGVRDELRRAKEERRGDEENLRSTITRRLRSELRRRSREKPAVLVTIVG